MPGRDDEIGFVPGYGWLYFGQPEAALASESDVLKEIMGSWLNQLAPWDVFFTGTWSRPVTPNGVLYGARRYLRFVERRAEVPIYAFLGVERGDTGGLLHAHSLIGNVAHLKPFCGELLARDKWGLRCCLLHTWPWGYARALPYDPSLGAAHYVSKYITKRLAEWELIGFPAAPQRVLPVQESKRRA